MKAEKKMREPYHDNMEISSDEGIAHCTAVMQISSNYWLISQGGRRRGAIAPLFFLLPTPLYQYVCGELNSLYN